MEPDISKLFDLDEIDIEDELDTELAAHYKRYRASISDKSEMELHNFLQQKASQSKRDYTEIVSALLYGILTEPENAQTFFHALSLVNRDQFGFIINRLHILASSIKFQSLKTQTRDQMMWLINELTALDVQSIENLYWSLFRQIRSGDVSQNNVSLCFLMLKQCEAHRQWLHVHPKVLAMAVYTYLRLIPDHRSGPLIQLQQREIKFITSLMREKWLACCTIGRDLIRLLQDVSSIPEFEQLWNDILNVPQKLSPQFKGIDMLLRSPTPREYLRSRLTPDMEHKLLFILQNLPISHYQRNLGWFMQRFLVSSESFYVDVIRFIVAGWYPNNQILQSDIVPRYVVIGSLLRAIKNPVVAANVKTALIFDWLFFTENDNIMFIEPSMLLMERSAERYPYITSIIMEFLKHSVDEYYPPLKDYMAKCVACGMRVMLGKGVIRSLMPIYSCPSTDGSTRKYMQELFGDFLTSKDSASTGSHAKAALPQMPSAASISSPILQSPSLQSQPSASDTSKIQEPQPQPPANHTSWDGRQEEEEDDVDRYLYGESNDTTANAAEMQTSEKIQSLDDDQSSSAQPMVIDDQDTELSSQIPVAEESTPAAQQPAPVTTASKVMESSQSYMMFGDSLVRFESACSSLVSGLESDDDNNGDEEEQQLQMTIAKRSLREVLDVYMRMAITSEALASSIALQVYEVSSRNLLEHAFTATRDNMDDVIVDSSQDLVDVLTVGLWTAHKTSNQSARDKMLSLLASVTRSINGDCRYLMGMRWWSFFTSRILQSKEGPNSQEAWMPSMIDWYRTFVAKGYGVPDAGLSGCLAQDMQLLAEVNLEYFFAILPSLYEYMPAYTVGNAQLIKLLAAVMVPDQLGCMVSLIQEGKIRCFGDDVDTGFLALTFAMDPYDTMATWELLSAELRGRQERIENFFNNPDIISIFHTQNLSGITTQVLSLLASAEPTSLLLETSLSLIPPPPNVDRRKTSIQLFISAVGYWYRNAAGPNVQQAAEALLDMIRNDPDESIRGLADTVPWIQPNNEDG